MAAVSMVVLHCADTPANLDIGVKEIRAWHMQDRGFSDIAYQEVVRRDGIIELGRLENGDSILEGAEIGAHAKGHNASAYGICWVGGKNGDQPTAVQKASLLKRLVHLVNRFGLTVEDVKGHYELDPGKTCPNLDMDDVRDSLRAMMGKKAG